MASSTPISPIDAEQPGSATPSADDLVHRVAQKAHDTIDRVADQAAPRVQALQERIGGAQEQLQARARQLGSECGEMAESVRDTVRAHPLTALGLALAAGFLIGHARRH